MFSWRVLPSIPETDKSEDSEHGYGIRPEVAPSGEMMPTSDPPDAPRCQPGSTPPDVEDGSTLPPVEGRSSAGNSDDTIHDVVVGVVTVASAGDTPPLVSSIVKF